MNTNFLNGLPVEIDVTFRILLAYLLGGLIGWERENAGQPAGLRTHLLVATGSCGFTLVFIYGFVGLGTTSDVARSASQIVVGIGFLGAGSIWRNRDRVRGITTAADIWVMAAIGMMAGAGMWYLALLLTVLGFFTLRILRNVVPVERRKQVRRERRASGDTAEDEEEQS